MTLAHKRTSLTPRSPDEDAEIIALWIAGDERATRILYEKYMPRLRSFISRLISDADRAEDLAQDAFIRAHRARGRFNRSKRFSTWIHQIAKNLSKNELHNRSRNVLDQAVSCFHSDDKEHGWQFADTRNEPDRLFELRELEAKVDWAAARLPTPSRIVFELRDRRGLEYQEIANILGVNLGTMKSRLNRSRQRFADSMRWYR